MNEQEIRERYLDAVTDSEDAWKDWKTNELWTPRATRALVSVGLAMFPDAEAASRGNTDSEGYSEYLTLDVCLWDGESPWQAPLFLAEHESKPWADCVRYSAWKLVVVEARCRLLITYFGPETPFADRKEVENAVGQVCRANPGRKLTLICAHAVEVHSNTDVKAAHEDPIVFGG